jgi:pSer/pThr/pTyr-binding forkhead associated (FHA) protein
MAQITLRVLDGTDRGRVFEQMTPPITIGREEGNTIQLNDERVSRFHVKIQEDHGKLVLTDLESTNGTKVNGEAIQLRILRFGDMISIGRSVLLFGSREEIASRLSRLKGEPSSIHASASASHSGSQAEISDEWLSPGWAEKLRNSDLPAIPEHLSPGQNAQLSELLEFINSRIQGLTSKVELDRKSQKAIFDFYQWQQLLDMQSRIAEFLRQIGDPDHT